MREYVSQGDVLKVDRIKKPVLVLSKDFFNKTGEIIGCPIYETGKEGALHIHVKASKIEGYVQCEKLALLDLNARRYSKADRLSTAEIIEIADAVQSIFDYI